MPRGERKSLQEKLNDVKASRSERKARYEKNDAKDAELERILNEKIVRQEVEASFEQEKEQRVQAKLAELNGSDASTELFTSAQDADSQTGTQDYDVNDQSVYA